MYCTVQALHARIGRRHMYPLKRFHWILHCFVLSTLLGTLRVLSGPREQLLHHTVEGNQGRTP